MRGSFGERAIDDVRCDESASQGGWVWLGGLGGGGGDELPVSTIVLSSAMTGCRGRNVLPTRHYCCRFCSRQPASQLSSTIRRSRLERLPTEERNCFGEVAGEIGSEETRRNRVPILKCGGRRSSPFEDEKKTINEKQTTETRL